METATTSAVAFAEVVNLTSDIALVNLGYLGISVSVITLLGVAFYFFNLKPLWEEVLKQKGQVRLEKENNKKKFEELAIEVENGIRNLDIRLGGVEYLAKIQKNINQLQSLIEDLKRQIKSLSASDTINTKELHSLVTLVGQLKIQLKALQEVK